MDRAVPPNVVTGSLVEIPAVRARLILTAQDAHQGDPPPAPRRSRRAAQYGQELLPLAGRELTPGRPASEGRGISTQLSHTP
jgi:hypothetical protein